MHIEHIHGTHLQLTVEDNGIGMPTSVTDNLFKPFMQGEISTTRRVDGTGLGLAITSNLLQLMNGDIAIKSAAGVGTTVAITLKLKTVEKTNVLTSLANQKVVWLTDDSFSPPRHFQKFFAKSHAQFHWYKTDKDLKGVRLPAPKGTAFVMGSDNCDVSKGWRDVQRSQCKKPKFILLSPDRGARLGLLEPDSY